jgi:hypothetical protein
MDYDDLRRKYGPKQPHERSNHVLLYAIILAALAGVIGYIWVGLPLAPGPVAESLDEATCRTLLESYEPALADQAMDFTEVYSTRTFTFGTGSKEYRWRIHNEGPVIADMDFLSGMPIYQKRLYFVWDGDDFVGCGLDYVFTQPSERPELSFESTYHCDGGGIEEAPNEIRSSFKEGNGYYATPYEMIISSQGSEVSRVHVSFSSERTDYDNSIGSLRMYGCSQG